MSKAISLEEQLQHNHLLSIHFHLVLLCLCLLQFLFGSDTAHSHVLEVVDNYRTKHIYFAYITEIKSIHKLIYFSLPLLLELWL